MAINSQKQPTAHANSEPAIANLSFDQLSSPDKATLETLREAIIGDGLFHLKLVNSTAPDVLKTADDLFACAKDLFGLSLEEKLKYDIDQIGQDKLDGYKPLGLTDGVTKGKRDGYEAYLMSRDSLFNGKSSKPLSNAPEVAQANAPLFHTFINQSHLIGTTILKAIAMALSLEDPDSLITSHQEEQRSTTNIGLLKYSPLCSNRDNLGHSAHTDVGTLTLLFTRRPGLQILPRTSEEWVDVNPMPGHIVINTGDSLRYLTNQRVAPCLHRVVPTVDADGADRYSCAYFMRPNLDTVFRDEVGTEIPSLKFHKLKYTAFDAARGDDATDFLVTGKQSYQENWMPPLNAPVC